MWGTIGIRRAGLAAAAALVIAAVTSATASATEICSDSPKVATSFCVDPSLALSSTIPGDPLRIDLTGADTSTNFSTDTNEWVNSAAVNLQSGGGSPVDITPSANMPNGLLIANSPACSGDYSNCSAGHGVFAGILSGTMVGADGYYEGTFGINKITNVSPADSGDLATYRVFVSYTVPSVPFIGTINGQFNFDAHVAQGSGAPGPISVSTRYGLTYLTASIDATLKSFALHLDGESSTLDGGGSAGQTDRIFGVPSCGAWSARATFTSGNARALSLDQSLTLPACPIAPSSTTPAPAPTTTATATGQRAAALKKCKKKKGKARKNCIKRAKKLPV
jgi:hypothetical protein